MYVFECEDSLDGIFSGIYDAFDSHLGHNNIRLSSASTDNMELFCQYRTIISDPLKSHKVAKKLREAFGIEGFEMLCEAALSHSKSSLNIDKAEAVYKTVVLGLQPGVKASDILTHLAEPHICQVFTLSRRTHNEAHHLQGFLRFKELRNGLLLAEMHPENYVLPILAEHFSDRLPEEDFIIYDATFQKAALHRSKKNFIIADAESVNQEFMHDYSDDELEYQQLWRTFFDSIAIQARKDPSLQSNNIPKRFWKDTVELA